MSWGDYGIDRTPKGGTITRAGVLLATGTRALNAKVIEILGFGLDVFDISCICNQGEVERLGAMPASERKAMVDRVIGVHRIEEVQKWTGEQALLLAREVEVLTRGLREPVEPVCPADYVLSSVLEEGVRALRAAKQEHDELAGWLSHMRSPPVAPPLREDPWSIDGLEAELDFARAYAAERARISALPVVDFDVEAVAAQWAAFDLWIEHMRFREQHPRPDITHDAVVALRENASKIGQFDLLTKRLNQHLEGEHVCCPGCGHNFPLGHSDIMGLRVQLAELGDFDHTPVDLAWVATQAQSIVDWRNLAVQETWARVSTAVGTPQPAVTRKQLAQAKLVGGISSTEKVAMLAALQPPEREEAEVRQLLAALRKWEALDNAYQNELPIYAAWRVEYDFKRARQIELAASVAKLPEVEAAWRAALAFEAERATYERDLALYTTLVAELVEKRAEVEGWRAAKASLIDLRLRIKTYLVPSLSKVASHLLSQMTDGQRSSIVVNENFDIKVDGQRLETLSGSGKACANLALRIGLGQVLTNKVVSLFVGDEIDAAMDTARATSTHSSIRMLSSQISQILLITHTLPVADTIVVLGAGADEQETEGIVRGL